MKLCVISIVNVIDLNLGVLSIISHGSPGHCIVTIFRYHHCQCVIVIVRHFVRTEYFCRYRHYVSKSIVSSTILVVYGVVYRSIRPLAANHTIIFIAFPLLIFSVFISAVLIVHVDFVMWLVLYLQPKQVTKCRVSLLNCSKVPSAGV